MLAGGSTTGSAVEGAVGDGSSAQPASTASPSETRLGPQRLRRLVADGIGPRAGGSFVAVERGELDMRFLLETMASM
jgi:hypothetical protein